MLSAFCTLFCPIWITFGEVLAVQQSAVRQSAVQQSAVQQSAVQQSAVRPL
jgi:hypothetical protein